VALTAVVAALTLTGVLASHRRSYAPAPARAAAAVPVPRSPVKLLGQRIMVGVSGTSPSAALLRSVRAGDVGSVILFASNTSRASRRSP